MKPDRFVETLKEYRITKARIARLNDQLVMLQRWLEVCTKGMINDMVSLSQAMTGMPHGTMTSDPTGRLAIDIESGKVSPFVEQIQSDITEVNKELLVLGPKARIVDVALGALSDKERDLVIFKMIDDMSWEEISHRLSQKYGKAGQSKRTFQRALERAMDKMYEVVR